MLGRDSTNMKIMKMPFLIRAELFNQKPKMCCESFVINIYISEQLLNIEFNINMNENRKKKWLKINSNVKLLKFEYAWKREKKIWNNAAGNWDYVSISEKRIAIKKRLQFAQFAI